MRKKLKAEYKHDISLKKKVMQLTFLFSDRVRCLSGVDSPELAGVAATADGDDLSKVPAGIVLD